MMFSVERIQPDPNPEPASISEQHSSLLHVHFLEGIILTKLPSTVTEIYSSGV
jgi:hypothetical protein